MHTNLQDQRELLKTALLSTDGYLNIEAHALRARTASSSMIKEFMNFYNEASKSLSLLGVLDQHLPYMRDHLHTIMSLSNSKYQSTTGYIEPDLEVGEVYEASKIKINFKPPSTSSVEKAYARQQALRKQSGLPDPSYYKKYAAQKQKEIDDMKTESGLMSFNTYLGESVENTLSETEIEDIVKHLSWEDIVDFYDENELVDVDVDGVYEELDEALSAQARLKKRQSFQRSKSKRNLSRNLKLRRASDPSTLQRRARQAAKRSIYKRLLKGRNRAQLSAAEKDRIEKQVSGMKNIMSTLQQKFVPKIRSIEQKRIANYRGKK